MMLRRLTLACLPLLAAVLTGTPAQAADSATDAAPLFEQPAAGAANFTGKWLNTRPGGRVLTSDGHEPPLNAAGKAEYAKRQAALKAGDHKIDPISSCLMHGIPRLLYTPYPFLILQTTRNISFVHEANHTFRIIYWDKAPADDPDPTYLGASVAHLDGKTLVIDSAGNFGGADIKVGNKWSLSDDGKVLTDVMSISTPQGDFEMTYVLNKQ